MKKIITLSLLTSGLLIAGPIHNLMDNRIKGQSYSGTKSDHNASSDGLGSMIFQHHSGSKLINDELKVNKKLNQLLKGSNDLSKTENVKESLNNGLLGTAEDKSFVDALDSSENEEVPETPSNIYSGPSGINGNLTQLFTSSDSSLIYNDKIIGSDNSSETLVNFNFNSNPGYEFTFSVHSSDNSLGSYVYFYNDDNQKVYTYMLFSNESFTIKRNNGTIQLLVSSGGPTSSYMLNASNFSFKNLNHNNGLVLSNIVVQ